MSDVKLDPELCREIAAKLRDCRLAGDVMQWIDRQYLPADDETLADRVVRDIRDAIDGGRCDPLETFENETAPTIAAQLTAAADLAERAAALQPVDPPPNTDDDAWFRLEERLELERWRRERQERERERRGALVAILGDIVIVATIAGAAVVALWCLGLAIWRWL